MDYDVLPIRKIVDVIFDEDPGMQHIGESEFYDQMNEYDTGCK